MMKKLLCLFVFLLPLAGYSATEPATTHQWQLDNGLTVLLRENHQAPVVSVMAWYKVGSIDEPEGATGISHVLEHMMFKQTKHLQVGEFSDLVSRFGGSQNAMTSYDYTAYYQNYAADRLPLALELEAERMHNLVIDAGELASELKVVQEERRMRVLDKPNASAWERFSAIARPGTGYAHPVIGWMHDIESIDADELDAWYRQYYQPSNAYLVVVGDATPEQVKTLVQRYFGAIKGKPVLRHASGEQQPPAGDRRVTLHAAVTLPALYLTYNVPTLSNAANASDYYALSMLAGVLDGGMSARLESRLVRGKRVAAGLGANYSGDGRGGGLFTLTATPNPDVTLAQLETALQAEITQLQTTPPSDAEMARVRAQVLAGDVYAKDSNLGQAMALGRLLVTGLPWQRADEFAAELAKVTPAQVSDVARRYLIPSRRALAQVLPLADKASQSAAEEN